MGLLEQRAALADKVAVVAGGGGGLGRAVSLDLAGAGVALAVCDRDADALGRTAADARALGVEVLAETLDVRDEGALERFFAAVDTGYERLDVLVNVVGGTFRAPFTEVDTKGRDTLVRTNFTWIVDATQHAARRMIAGGRGGSIITLTSIEAHRAAPGHAVYSAMKAAVAELGRTLAVEVAPDGIRFNAIAPAFVPTEGLQAMGFATGSPEDDPREVLADAVAIPMGRRGRYDDVGGCALFLASDLSRYVTGTTLHPDGGAWASAGWFHWPDRWSNRLPDTVLDGLAGSEGPTA